VAYLSLYRKYRPQSFDAILGQGHVSTTLANAIAEDRVAHAYLFTGPHGTGKTSTARLLAKALNCSQGPTPNPCGKCPSCIAIADGSSLDVMELDAASHSGVDDTRDILAGVALATAGSHKKIYVIDEVHMLTTPSFNALLKTLEEPPPHVIFILATTEAHKVLHTIQSRTQRFDFRPIPADILQQHLAAIAKSEAIEIDDNALAVVARHADGSARDALSILDQLSSYGEPITASDVERLLGGRPGDAFVELFDAIASGDVGGVFWTLHTLVAQGADARVLGRGALEHARSLLLLKTAPDAEDLLDAPEVDRPALASQAGRFTAGSLLRAVDLIAKALTDMREAPNHRLLLEVALVRAAAPNTDPASTGLLGRLERIERRLGIDSDGRTPISQETTEVGSADDSSPQTTDAESKSEKPAPAAKSKSEKRAPAAETKSEQAAVADTPAAEPPPPAEVGYLHFKESWTATLKEIGKRSKRVAAFLTPSRPLRFDGESLRVELQSEFHVGEMDKQPNRAMLSDALFATLGVRPRIEFEPQGSAEATSASEDRTTDYTDAKPAEEHDAVELVKKGLGAEIVEER
jgi:DNA polymerase III subunit gamma/tau